MNDIKNKDAIVVLDSGLFEDRETIAATLLHLHLPEKDWYKLTPDSMIDRDWDDVVSLVLSAKRVITV